MAKWAVTHPIHSLLLQQRVRSPGPTWAAETGVENEGLGDWTPGRGYSCRQVEEKCGLVCKTDGVEPKQLMLCNEPMFCLGQVKRLSQCRRLHSVILDTPRLFWKRTGTEVGRHSAASLTSFKYNTNL